MFDLKKIYLIPDILIDRVNKLLSEKNTVVSDNYASQVETIIAYLEDAMQKYSNKRQWNVPNKK